MGTVATVTKKIIFKSLTFTEKTLPVLMIAIQEKIYLNFNRRFVRPYFSSWFRVRS